jgi:UDP-N-acetylmuramoyl-L-alanyl-D-glutamate--2,6-diaminopimelate ligase
MDWVEALKEVSVIESAGAAEEIASVEYDSRRVRPGAAFVAMRGGTTDGNQFIDAAIAQGAVAVVTDSREAYERLRSEHVVIAAAQVEHGRRALAELSAAVLGHPERKVAVSAVTGTNGKTTTAYLLEQLLRSVGRKCVLIGTIETRVGDEVRPSEHTTPEASDLLKIFADGVSAGATEVVMEMSSHALDQERVWGIPVDVGIFTNLTQDHLDYHGTMEDYAYAKSMMFAGVGTSPPRVAVINQDDRYAGHMWDEAGKCEVYWGYGIEGAGTSPGHKSFVASDVTLEPAETRFVLATPAGAMEVRSRLVGRVNIYNLTAAIAAAFGRGLSLEQIGACVGQLRSVPGRFEVVPGSAGVGFTVVVDYAHTDDALLNLITLARELVAGHGGRVITLFGCGGDRDKTKRPKMARVATDGSDLVVVTSDNPRSEDPMSIIEDVMVGARGGNGEVVIEADRRAAISVAIEAAQRGDIVLLAGKGHEKTQTFADRTVPFDDVSEAALVLRELERGKE